MPQSLRLTIDDSDLRPDERDSLLASKRSDRILGDSSVFEQLLPRLIARRLERIVPPGFVVDEIGLTLSVDATLLGVGASGEVAVTLRKSDT